MKVTLVQPPCARTPTIDLAPPLGLLSVAGRLREAGHEPRLVDLNLRGIVDPESVRAEGFYERCAASLLDTDAQVFGFTSMALDSHVSLGLARTLKRLDPGIRTVLGGPHFSAIAGEVLRAYEWIDHVVMGEGEAPMVQLVGRIQAGRPPDGLENVAGRAGGRLVSNRAFSTKGVAPRWPRPALDLVDLDAYFAVNPFRTLHHEHARGCVFDCAFCYSPVHWGRGERAKAIDTVVEDIAGLKAHGARRLFFVGDNFLNNPARAVELCEALADAALDVDWHCYATQAQLRPRVVEALGAAGCKAAFIGVDSIDERANAHLEKRFYRGWEALRTTLERCLDSGVRPTCAFMFDGDASGELSSSATLDVAARARSMGCGVRLNLLTPYPSTGLGQHGGPPRTYTTSRVRLLQDTHPLVEHSEAARARPHLFPFHATERCPARFHADCEALAAAREQLETHPRAAGLVQEHLPGALWTLCSRESGADPAGAARAAGTALDPPDRDAALKTLAGPGTAAADPAFARELDGLLALDGVERELRRARGIRKRTCKVAGRDVTLHLAPFRFVAHIDSGPGPEKTPESPPASGEKSQGSVCTLVGDRMLATRVARSTVEALNRLWRSADSEILEVSLFDLPGLLSTGVVNATYQ